jgi:hypothetical protein
VPDKRPSGHTFVLRGDLRRLVADTWLLPVDVDLNVSESWIGHAPGPFALVE